MTIDVDDLTVAQLRGTLGKKWTIYPDCIGAFIAEMDFGTAPVVKDALIEAVTAGYFGYIPPAIENGMREAAAGWYQRHTDWHVTPDMVRSLPDVLRGFEILVTKYAPRGGSVVLPTPNYMPFLSVPGIFGREVQQVPMVSTGDGWELDFDGIEQAFANGGEVLILCNPQNPIGKVYTAAELLQVGDIVARYNGRVFVDEIHAPILYSGQKHVPYASVSATNASHAFTTISASKAWNLAGLKNAQLVVSNPADLESWEDNGSAFLSHSSSVLGVVANTVAYNEGEPWLRDVLAYLEANRDALADLVAEHLPGVTMIKPQGTYLAWLDFTNTPVPDDVGSFFRERAHVAITPGAECGLGGERHVRFNFALSRPLLVEAVTRMGKAMASL